MIGDLLASGFSEYPTYSWESLPPAASVPSINTIYQVSNIPIGGSSLWFSNGSDWYPVGGCVVLDSKIFVDVNNVQLGLISTTSQTIAIIAGWSLIIPANLFKGVGTVLRVIANVSRSANINAAGCYCGVMPFDLDNTKYLASVHFGANNNIGKMFEDSLRVSPSQVQGKLSGGNANLGWNGAATITSFSNLIDWDEATNQTLYPVGIVSSTPGDTVYVRNILVQLLKVPQ